MSESSNGVATMAAQASEQSDKIIDKLYAAAEPGAVFSAPYASGEYTIITASEVGAGGGFGFGMGTSTEQKSPDGGATGGGGGGGGGGSMGRPIAAIVIGPDGVKVKPIVDATKVALAAIGAWSAVAFIASRLARAKKG